MDLMRHEVAKMYKISVDTVKKALETGLIRTYKKDNELHRGVLYLVREDVEKFDWVAIRNNIPSGYMRNKDVMVFHRINSAQLLNLKDKEILMPVEVNGKNYYREEDVMSVTREELLNKLKEAPKNSPHSLERCLFDYFKNCDKQIRFVELVKRGNGIDDIMGKMKIPEKHRQLVIKKFWYIKGD